jgi:Spy/CpxP family protein refolding chaperone
MKKIFFIVTMVLLIGTASLGIAFQGHKSGGHNYGNKQMQVPLHRWWKLPQASELLNITPEETKKLDGLYQNIKEKLIDSGAQLQKDMLKLEMQFDSDAFDQKKCMQIFKEVQTTRTKLALEKFEFALKTREILGKERFDKLLNTFKKFKRHGAKKGKQQRQKKNSAPKTEQDA